MWLSNLRTCHRLLVFRFAFRTLIQVTFLSLSFPPMLPVLDELPLDGEGALFIFANLRLPPEDSLVAPATNFGTVLTIVTFYDFNPQNRKVEPHCTA